MLVAPRWKHLTFSSSSNVCSGDLHNIRDAKPPQLVNLLCGPILIRESPADELVIFSTRRVGKNRYSRRDAALHEMRFGAPAPPKSDDMTMRSTGRTVSLMTSAHPAVLRIGSRTGGTATIANAPNATTTRTEGHLGPPGDRDRDHRVPMPFCSQLPTQHRSV